MPPIIKKRTANNCIQPTPDFGLRFSTFHVAARLMHGVAAALRATATAESNYSLNDVLAHQFRQMG